MEEEIETFADEEYEPQEIDGRMVLRLHGKKEKRKKIEAVKIPKLYDAMREGCDIDIQHAVVDGAINIKQAGLDTGNQGKYIIAGKIIVGNSVMRGIVNFDEAIFERPAHFSGSIFKQTASFVAIFKQTATFNGTCFEETTSFSGARFVCDANFMGTVFNQGAFFSRTRFELPARFIGTEFKKLMGFIRVDMEYPARFEQAHLSENTVWHGLWNYFFRPILWPILWLFTIGKVRLPEATFTDILGINTTIVMDGSSNPWLKRYIDDEQWIYSWRSNPKSWLGRLRRNVAFWL